jgi:hypothetical protein
MLGTELLKSVNNKKVLFGAIIVFIIPFVLFAFWNFPSADDYMIINKRSQFSFWELQSDVYQNWSGRYFATFVSCLFSYSGFLYSHYYLHTLLLLVFTVFSWLFCLTQINKYLLNNTVSQSSLVLFSLLLLILEINIIPEPVTAFYWFSSAVTYQLPLIIMVFLAGIIIKLLFASVNKVIYFFIASLLIIMLNGCNEIITLFVLIYSTSLLGYNLFIYKKIPLFPGSLYVLSIITACFLLFSPGLLNRGAILGEGSFISGIGIASIKFAVLNWFFLKEPLWWFSTFFVIVFLSDNKKTFGQTLKPVNNLSITSLLVFYVASGLLIYIPVLYVTNGSLPLRAENIICFLFSLILLFIISTCISNKINKDSVSASLLYQYRYLLFSILIFSTANMKKVTDSLMSGYFYQLVMKERLSLLENAKHKNQHEVTFVDYETAVKKKIKEDFPIADRQVLKDIIVKPPPIICFGGDLYDLNYMKQFFGLRKLNIAHD